MNEQYHMDFFAAESSQLPRALTPSERKSFARQINAIIMAKEWHGNPTR